MRGPRGVGALPTHACFFLYFLLFYYIPAYFFGEDGGGPRLLAFASELASVKDVEVVKFET